MNKQSRIIGFTSQGWSGYGFGRTIDERVRFQIFHLQEHVHIQGINVYVRLVNGTSQTGVTFSLGPVKDGLPSYDTFGLNVPGLQEIDTKWTLFSLTMSYDLDPGYYALVLGQNFPQEVAYELAVGAKRADMPFGKGYTPIIGSDVVMYIDESGLGTAWMQLIVDGEGEIIDVAHSGDQGFGFGNLTDEIKRYQTFMTSDHSTRITGVDLRIRRFNGVGQDDVTVDLYQSTYLSRPTGLVLASAVIPAACVSEQWTTVHAPLMCNGIIPNTLYAIVVGQCTPKSPRYEWCVKEINEGFFFGKWNGGGWIDESGLGNGWMKIWGHPAIPMYTVGEFGQTPTGYGFGNSTDEIKRFQVIDVSQYANGAIMGLDLKLRKYNGTGQSAVTVELFNTGPDGLPTGSPIERAVIPDYSVREEWTIVHAPLWHNGLSTGPLAIVLGQEVPNSPRYEWSTQSALGWRKFGKWDGISWRDESSLGVGFARLWIDGPITIIDASHSSTSGNGFGAGSDEIKRFETIAPARPIQVRGIQLKIRKAFGTGQSDVIVELYNTQNFLPVGSPLVTAIVESSSIGQDWTAVNVPIASSTFSAPFAVVLGQRTPMQARYEWAAKEVNSAFHFGKWNGSNWVDESGLGDGWTKVWCYT